MKRLSVYLEKVLLLDLAGLFILIPYSKNIVKTFFCAAAALWLLINIFRHKQKFYRGLIPPNPLNIPLLIFLGAAILSIIFSLNPYHSQSVFFDRYFPYAVFFFVSLFLVKDLREERIKDRLSVNLYFLIGAFLLSGIIFGLGGIFDYARLHPARIWTVFGREIPFKMFPVYLVYFIPFSLTLFLFSKKWVRWVGLVSLIPLVFCWVLQGSRDAWLAVLFSVTAVLLFHKKRIMLTLLLAVFVILTFFFLPKHTQKRAEIIVQPVKWGVKWGARVELWKTAGRIFEDFPVFGAGIGMYDKLVSKYSKEVRFLHAHNTYLEIASEMGLVGLLAFLWIFAVFFKNALRTIKKTSDNHRIILLGLSGSILSVLIYGMASSIITVGTQSAPLFWILLGMASGLISKS